MYIGIDQSKRSTAAVAIGKDGQYLDCLLVTPPLDMDGERLVDHVWSELSAFMVKHDPYAIALEGAAFAAGGSSSDLLWGIQWYIRTRTFVEFPDVPIGILTPATWRATIVSSKEQNGCKLRHGGKIGLKYAVRSKIPEGVLERMKLYLECEKRRILASKGKIPDGRSNVHLDGLHDLCDAYGIALHRYKISAGLLKKCYTKKKAKISKSERLNRRFPGAE